MTVFEKLLELQRSKNTRLCVGLDPRVEQLPKPFKKNLKDLQKFLDTVIEITHPFACAYKINFAFFEQFGYKGLEIIENIKKIIPKEIVTIADAKRSDIGSTAQAYAKSVYSYFDFDSITLNPYLGIDSLLPFFEYEGRLNFVLICTSNSGSADFQKIKLGKKFFFEIVLEKLTSSFPSETLGLVVGATNPSEFRIVRQKCPQNFILTPGIGAQGGNLDEILRINQNLPLVVNVSRDIIFASSGEDFEKQIYNKAKYYSEQLRITK